ncbi:cardiomyopathy-associated protein 5 isoform X1 [Zootoca vivipara]|uniref:cardiomyopathy-associated protein 5 isoform X1 n=1 Tax=Zootoca vivipara TaxID=8524 RepID=UPI00293B9A67|nr:cardiomyopathy-associated protein 5 isoform X1 [Zootoca vivipara]
METDCNYESDGSPDVSMEDEEEDEYEPNSSLKSLNQHEEVKSDAMDAIHSEDSAQTWETSSSRCSTSQASETSATSGVYSMENSYVEGPPGKSISLMDGGKMVQKRTRNSPYQVPLFPNEKMGPHNEKCGFSGRPTEAKALERELDPADPQPWTLQVQPSKIKNYLVQITQEVVDPLPEEKENVFMKKAELPLEGTVRAKIQLLTAALEERNKKIFRRVNNIDLPPPTVVVIRKPREPPKKFTRQTMFQASLKHLEQQATIKNDQKEILHLKRMQTMLAKSVPRNRDEERVRRSFLPESLDKASKMVPPTSPLCPDKAKKLDTESHPPATRMTAPEQARFASPDRHERLEKRGKQSQLSNTANTVSEKLPSLLVETEEEEEAAEEIQPPPIVSTKPFSQPATGNEAENQDDSTFSKLSESAPQDVQYPNSIAAEQYESQDSLFPEIRNPDIGLPIPSQFEIKDSGLLHSAEEAGRQDVLICSPELAEPVPEQAKSPPPVSERETQEKKQLEAEYSKKEEAQEQSTPLLQAEPAHLTYSLKEWEVGEAETAPNLSSAASRIETQESQSDSCEVAEEHIGLSQPTHFMGEAKKREKEHLEPDLAKEAVETQVFVTASLQPEQSDAQHASEIKNQTAQPGSQWLESSLPIPEAQREEIQQHSLACAQSESEHPVISEPIKATQGFELLETLHLKGKEVSANSPAEALDSSEQLSSVSSAEKVEMLETQQPLLETVTLFSEQLCSVLSYPTEKMEKKDSLPCSPETAAEIAEASLPTATFQTAEVTKVEVHPLSPTEVPSEESVSISREPDVAIDRKTTQLVSPISVEPPSEASVLLPQEAAKEENQQRPPSDAKLTSEDQDEEGQQDGWFPLFATTQFEPGHLTECESTIQSIEQDSSASFLLEEATALHSVDDADKKERHPDKSITEPSLHPVFMPEKQGRTESEIEQTTHQLSHTVLPMESSKLQSVEEMGVNEIKPHLSATGQVLSQSVYLTEPQEDQCVAAAAAAAALESGSLSIPYTEAEVEKCDTTEPVSKEVTYQAIQAVTAEMEQGYLKVSHIVSESEKHFGAPFPAQNNTEEGNLQSHKFVSPESEDEHFISSEREESEFYPLLTPTPELGYPIAGSETQESQSYLSDALNEALNALNEQPSYSSSVLEDKAKIEENQTPFPETPKMAPDESLSFAAFLISEAKQEPLVSPVDTKMTPKESNSTPEDFVSEEVKEIAPPSSPLSSEQLSKEVISSYAAAEEENQDQSHSLLREESKHLDAGGADVQGSQSHLLVAAQPEARSQDIELYCPQTAESELEDLTLLNSTEEIQKQEIPLYSPSVHEEVLHHKEERENQGPVILGTEQTKEEDAPLKSPVLPQELEHLHSLQSVKEPQMERAETYSSAAVQDSLQLLGETGSQEGQGYFYKTAEVDSGVSKLSELTVAGMEQEIQVPKTDAVRLERKQSALSAQQNEKVQHPLVTASLDLEHLGSSYSTETQFPGEPLPDASLLTEKAEEQDFLSQPVSVSPSSVLDQSSSASLDLIAEVEEQEAKHPPEVANVMPEEPLSFAAFLLAEAKEIHTSLTSEKENLDSQPPLKEADLLIARSESISTSPPETNVTIKEVTELPPTRFEVEQFVSKPEADFTYRDERENISETPTLPNLIPNEPSDAVMPEPINDILTHNLHSSHMTDNKTILISAEDFSKTEEIKSLPSAEITLKEPEKELKDHKKLREEAIPAVELGQGKEISEGNGVVNIHAAPLNSSADKEEEKHMPERFEYLETAALQKRKPFRDAGDMAVDQELSRCKISVKTSEGIDEDNHENKEIKSNELVKEKGVQESVEMKREVSIVQESNEDGGVNDNSIDHIEKHTVVDETGFIQTGKEQSFKEVQRQFEVNIENSATLPTVGTKNISEFSSLERDLDEGFNRMAKKGQEDPSTILIKGEIIDTVRGKDENTEDKLNVAGEPLFITQKDVLAQSPLISLPATEVNPELLEVPPTLAFLYKDLYEEAVEKPKEDSHKYPSNEETENPDVSFHIRGPTREDGTGMCFERDVSKDDTPTLEESQEKQVLKDKTINEQALTLQRVSKCADEPSEKKPQSLHILTEAHAETEVSSPRGMGERLDDALVDRPAEIMSDIKVGNGQPTNEILLGSELFGSDVSNEELGQRRKEESLGFERDVSKADGPNLEESQKEQVLKDEPRTIKALNQARVSKGEYESDDKEPQPVYILAETHVETEDVSPKGILEGLNDGLIDRPVEIMGDIKVETCQPTHAVPFGSGLFGSGASNDDSSQRSAEESLPEETGQALPEETSDEESCPILDYAASVFENATSVRDESEEVACFAIGRNQQSEITDAHEMDNVVVPKPDEESSQSHAASHHHVSPPWQSEGQPEDQLIAQDTQPLDHKHILCRDTEGQTSEKRVGENIVGDLTESNREAAYQPPPEAISDKPFGELDYSLLSHDFDTYPLYSIKEEESSDIDEDLAELMDYEVVSRDDVFEEETSSEVVHEELLFDDRKSSDRISDSYEFVNEREANTYAEGEEFQLMGLDKLPRNVPETEVLQKESDHEPLDSYCRQCKCPISAEDKLSGEHKEHTVTNLDTAVTELKSQLDGFLDVLQERSLKIEGFVSEIEALFNSLEENCKEKEQLLDEQNESIIKTVIGHHDRKQQSFEEVKNAKMDYLYEQMVNFQEYVDTAKDTLEAILKETEEMDDFVFLSSSEEINKRLLSAVENILALEKIPPAFSQFEHFASGSANGNQTLKHMPVPQTPKLQAQDPNSATSTSIAVYWTVNEDDVIDFFQVYCMEECPGNREQSGLVEEYRVTVKESNCILEDLEPGHCYSVWVMAVNYSGCSFPSGKSTFRTAPPTPVIKAEECSVCWDTATIRWSTSNPEATDSFTLEYCRQYSPEGEGLRSLAGIKRPEMKVHLQSNVNYFFYVRAINIFGTSEQSEAALISTRGTRFHIMEKTAAPPLQVSPSGTMICLPEETEATAISPVLGELLSARGWHYWETSVSGCSAYKVGICYSTMPQDSILGQNNASWCLHCPSKTSFLYKVLHRGEMSDVIVTEQPPRIGILLDYNAGRLLFFNAERGQLLFAIRQKFTDAAHPAFVLEEPGVLHLHTGMELPEFVKQS